MSDLIRTGTDMLEHFQSSGDTFSDASDIIEAAQDMAHRAVNVALLQRNWLLGKRIAEEELYHFYKFYKEYPDIFQSVIGKSLPVLSWTHYLVLMRIFDKEARSWYEQETIREAWSVRTLQRNVDSQYYYRLLRSQVKASVEAEMRKLTVTYQEDRLEFIKNPMVVEFLGLSGEAELRETNLETSIITNLQKFLMELVQNTLLKRSYVSICSSAIS